MTAAESSAAHMCGKKRSARPIRASGPFPKLQPTKFLRGGVSAAGDRPTQQSKYSWNIILKVCQFRLRWGGWSLQGSVLEQLVSVTARGLWCGRAADGDVAPRCCARQMLDLRRHLAINSKDPEMWFTTMPNECGIGADGVWVVDPDCRTLACSG